MLLVVIRPQRNEIAAATQAQPGQRLGIHPRSCTLLYPSPVREVSGESLLGGLLRSGSLDHVYSSVELSALLLADLGRARRTEFRAAWHGRTVHRTVPRHAAVRLETAAARSVSTGSRRAGCERRGNISSEDEGRRRSDGSVPPTEGLVCRRVPRAAAQLGWRLRLKPRTKRTKRTTEPRAPARRQLVCSPSPRRGRRPCRRSTRPQPVPRYQ